MYKKLSARTKALLSACLDNVSYDEHENNSGNNIDIVENSPQSSPKPTKTQKTALPFADANHPKSGEFQDFSHDLTSENRIEPNFHCFEDSYENVEDKSIEPPPYSPLTPRPLSNWSDSCGGQNRNIKLTLMLKALLSDHPTLKTIRLRFLESGHSFLPNDTDFGRIECALKLQQRLYTADDYMRIMKTCKKNNPMQVHKMGKEDFLSSANLEKRITNRKKATDGSKVSWLNTKEIMLKKEDEFSIFMRSNLDEDYVEINLKKSLRGNSDPLSKNIMHPLWPNGKPIPEAKLNDIKSLLHLIPEDAQDFYKKLTGDVTIEDDIDGFSGVVDFEMEVDEGD